MQRKGLHHLLSAWKRARLGDRSGRLTVVSRVIEPGLKALFADVHGATLRSDVTQQQLEDLYDEASLFCMPSLVEGFGQVYLEALSHGLPVLGTPNTCLPDLGTEEDGIFIVEPGDVDGLAAMLQRLSASIPGNEALRGAARNCSERFTWQEFRRKIAHVVESLDATRNQREGQPVQRIR